MEVDNLTKKDTSNFPSSPKDAESALAGCYSILPYGLPSQKSFYLAELLSDDRFGGAGEGDSDTQAVNQMKKKWERTCLPTDGNRITPEYSVVTR